jgi:DNA-binding phage protein
VLDAIQIMPTRDYKESLFEDLKDPEFVVAYLNAALEKETHEVFLLHLRDVADA